MRITPTAIPEVLLIEPKVFGDDRGFFFESWNERAFAQAGIGERFVQDNHSSSQRGVNGLVQAIGRVRSAPRVRSAF